MTISGNCQGTGMVAGLNSKELELFLLSRKL